MSKTLKISRSIPVFMGVISSLACSSGEVDLGGGLITADLRSSGRCTDSSRLEGQIIVSDQAGLSALAGCEEIVGDLFVEVFEGADLSPLASLRSVSNSFHIGEAPVQPEDPNEWEAFWERIAGIRAAGYLPSLHGLEALESVGTLYLTGSSAPSLTELESLVDVEAVVIRDMPALVNLAGLEAAPLSSLWISNCQTLSSLDGLNLGLVPETLIFEFLPALTNADALAATDIAFIGSSLMFYVTGLRALPSFVDLAFVPSLSIEGNPALTDISGIASIQGVEGLSISGNPSLRTLPPLTQLGSVEVLRVINNDALEELDLDFPALLPPTDSITDRNIELSTTLIDISMNDALRRITSPAGFGAVQYFSIYQNASLSELELDQLRRVDVMIIAENPALVTVSMPALATVDSLEVVDNPALSPAVFDRVLTFERRISGNAETPAP
jgi:hypothetical protein